MDEDKKRLKKEYRENGRPMGVFLIRNMVNDKIFLGVGLDLPGIINRHRFELTMGMHRNRQLQADWNEYGSEKFSFEIFDQIALHADPNFNYREELSFLEDLWLEKLEPYGERGYNEPKLTREEKLRKIARSRSDES